MKIERVDDKTVKCFISNEELAEYEIDYKDFVLRSEKAKQVVHDIIETATREVGYKPPKFAFDMQIMMLPDQGLLLTFSESDPTNIPNLAQIAKYLKDVEEEFGIDLSATGMDVKDLGRKVLDEVKKGVNRANAAQENSAKDSEQKQSAAEPEKPGEAIFVFEALSDVMDYAQALPGNLRTQSALYEMNEKYYLYLQKGSASYKRYSRACIQAMEFGKLYGTEESKLLPMKEHGGCLIPEKALQKLRL